MKLLCLLRRHVILPWDLERSHALIALGYGVYIQLAQSFRGPGPGGRMMGRMAQAVAPELAAEAVWGSLLVLTGVLTLLGLLLGSPETRRGSALLRAAIWSLMALCFGCANPISPGGFLWGALAFSALMCALQISK